MWKEFANLGPVFEFDVLVGRLVEVLGLLVEGGSFAVLFHLFQDLGTLTLEQFVGTQAVAYLQSSLGGKMKLEQAFIHH